MIRAQTMSLRGPNKGKSRNTLTNKDYTLYISTLAQGYHPIPTDPKIIAAQYGKNTNSSS